MSPERWQQVKRLFNEAIELAPAERAAFLERESIDAAIRVAVEELLAADETDDFCETPVANLASLWQEADDEEIENFAGRRVGNYRIEREIGRGGMGVVFEAVREGEDFSQRVALKLLKRGMDSAAMLRRFRSERQILASLEHPNIARLLDGGRSDDGLPFFALELVEGVPLDDYCRRENLSIGERLRLFRQICAAVSFAHSRLIIHRDLKPTNILVTKDGVPKLLDFGIAKILSDEPESIDAATVTKLGMMTPQYASPEQARGEIVTTASDVYSLGLILYKILTNCAAYEFANNRPDEIARVICEVEPPPPSRAIAKAEDSRFTIENSNAGDDSASLSLPHFKTEAQKSKTTNQSKNPKTNAQNLKSLRGDLDNIVLKALRKEPNRRYASVEQFSEDIRRHLEGLPVTARSDTVSYRLEKFVSRNRAVVASGVLVFLVLIVAVVGIYSQYVRAERQRVLAESRFNDVRQLANNVVFKYHDAVKELPGATGVREMMVKDATAYLDRLAADTNDDPTLERELAQAYLKIGNVEGEAHEANLGDTPGALLSYRKSGALLEKLIGAQPGNPALYADLQKTNYKLIALLSRREEWSEAYALSRKNIEIALRLLESAPDNAEYQVGLATAYNNHGEAVQFAEGYEGQVKMYRQGLAITEDLYSRDASNEIVRRRLTAALQHIGTYTEYWCDALREQNAPAADIRAKLEEAVAVHRRSVALSEELMREFPNNELYRRYVAATTNNLCSSLARIGDGKASLGACRLSLNLFEKIAAADDKNNETRHDLGETYLYMGMAYEASDDVPKALENYRRSVELFESLTESDPTNSQFPAQANQTRNRIGDLLLKKNRLPEARSEYWRGLDFVGRFAEASGNAQLNQVLRSDSNFRLGRSYQAETVSAPEDERAARLERACTFYEKAQADLLALEKAGALNRIHRYKLDLLAAAVSGCKQ